MEKQLMDKIRHHTLDDVDKAMILARLRVAHSEVEDILDELNKSLEKLHNLCNDKKDEMALLDFRFVLACDDKIIHNDDEDDKHDGVPCLCTVGTKDELEGLLKAVQKAIDS